MLLKNAVVYGADFEPVKSDLLIANGKIAGIGSCLEPDEELDLSGFTILPGFIDIHIHGCAGADMNDASARSLEKMSVFLAQHGVTSFCPATMAQPEEQLARQFQAVAGYMGSEKGAYIHGVNMEGPFLSTEKKGAQPAEHIRKPDIEMFKRLFSICKISLVDLAPEIEGAFAFAREACACCTVSQAHTDADFETAASGYQNGFSHATHLFSAMPPIEHRAPGPVVAAFDNPDSTAELICDGLHAHPPVLRMAFKLLGEDRAVAVSDANKAAGCGDGEYDLAGQTIYVKNGKATLKDGTFAASTTNLYEEFLNLLKFGIPFKHALKSCTINPAKAIRADGFTGSLAPGKNADILVLDADCRIRYVFVKGRML